MTASTEPTLAPGTRLAHYQIEDQLGSGAMGTVYRSHDTALDRAVAVKVLRARLAEDATVVDRFVREARAAARVNHPNLTHVYFVGAEQGLQFFAMEYVPGATFEQEIASGGPMPLAKFIDVIVQSARGLAAAHGAGVIHRDVKPSNLMLLPNGTVKVTDFGLAKSLGGDVGASMGGALLGTPIYMSPEQCRSLGVDARTDIYCLGLTAWFLLAGKPPYASESLGQILNDQMNTALPSVCALRPELPAELDGVLARLCAKDPTKRPASMDEVAALFEPLRPRPLEPATFAARASAFVIDSFAVVLVAGFVVGMIAALEQWLHIDVVPKAVSVAFFGVVLVAAHLGIEMWLGTTVGKWLLNLRVVRADGATPGRGALLVRFLLRYPATVLMFMPTVGVAWIVAFVLQGFAFALGAAWFAAYKGRTLSDRVTKTRVVYRGDAPVSASAAPPPRG